MLVGTMGRGSMTGPTMPGKGQGYSNTPASDWNFELVTRKQVLCEARSMPLLEEVQPQAPPLSTAASSPTGDEALSTSTG